MESGADTIDNSSCRGRLFGHASNGGIVTCHNAALDTLPYHVPPLPVFPGHAERIHHSFEEPPAPGAADPDTTMAVFRRVRDQIREWVGEFIREAG